MKDANLLTLWDDDRLIFFSWSLETFYKTKGAGNYGTLYVLNMR